MFAIRQAETIPAGKRLVINLRVGDLGQLLESLKSTGVSVERQQDYVYGRFAWLRDPEGNELELFEPA